MSKEWDKENMRTLSVNLKKDAAEAFKAYAAEHDTTVGALLRGFVEATLSGDKRPGTVEHPAPGEYWYPISYKMVDKLKHETAFYNPKGGTPTDMLEVVLRRYFEIAEKLRGKK